MVEKRVILFTFLMLWILFPTLVRKSLAADVETVGNLKVGGVIESTSGGFKFPDGTTWTTGSMDGLLFNVGFVVDDSASNTGNLTSGAIKFGSDTSGEGIASQRTSGTAQNGLDFYTGSISRLTIKNNGYVGIGTRDPYEQLEITGNFRLPATTATTGIIKSGFNTFLHSYGPLNFFAGVSAGNTTMAGSRNVGVGEGALHANSSGGWNAGVGAYALMSNTTGIGNSAMGATALYNNTTGTDNTAIGSGAINANVTGSYNTAVGTSAMFYSTGYGNTAVGTGSMQQNTTGNYNSATGRSALGNNITGGFNAAYGYYSLFGNTSGSNNTAIGYNSGYTSTSANANTTGSNNTFIGSNSGPGTNSALTNATAIGANALVSQSDSLVLGAPGVKVGIGTATPVEALDVVGNVKISGVLTPGSIVSTGDLRMNDKNIYLRTGNDTNHGLGWYGSGKAFTGAESIDGPVLYGYTGGALGTTAGGQKTLMKWHWSDGFDFYGYARFHTLSGGSTSACLDGNNTISTCSSDARMKKDVITLSDNMDVLKALGKLRGVMFNWDRTNEKAARMGSGRDLGMIAQEVEEVFPEIVHTDSDGYKSMDYPKLVAFLIEVNKGQQNEIEDLRRTLQALDRRLSEIEVNR